MTRENLTSDRVLNAPDGSAATPSTLRQLWLWVGPTNGSTTPQPVEKRALIVAALLAVVAWLLVLWFRAQPDPINIWTDQIAVFRRSLEVFSWPYQLGVFVNPPWLMLLLAPFAILPVELSVLIQAVCYFVIITLIIYRFGGDFLAVLITLTSFIALDAVIEMNVDWFVLIGLLVPVEISPLFLLIKPQLALGYYFGIPWRKWAVIVLIAIVAIAISSLLWPNWTTFILNRVQTSSIQRTFNLAPSKFLPSPFISWLIGATLAWWSFRRQDPPLGILAWFFFTPYIALYSMVLLLAILAIRWRFLAIAISAALWVSAAYFL